MRQYFIEMVLLSHYWIQSLLLIGNLSSVGATYYPENPGLVNTEN